MKMTVKVRNLMIGDVFVSTGRTVTSVGVGVNTPRGRVDVGLNGVRHTFGADTTIMVTRG